MKKILSGLLILMTAVSFMPVNAHSAALTLTAGDTWADGGAGDLGPAAASDTVNLATFTMTVESDAANDDNGGLLLFTIGAVTGTTGDVVVNGEDAAVTNDWVANFTSFTLTGAGDITYRIDDADNFALTSTVSGALSTAGAVTIDNDEADATKALTVTVTGNYTATGATTIDSGTAAAGNSAALTLTGATVTGTGGFVLDEDTGTATLTFNRTSAQSITGTINGAAAGEGALVISGAAGTQTFNSAIGTTQALRALTVSGASATANFLGNVTVNGDFTVSNAATINIGANTVDLGGAADGDFILRDGAAATLAFAINSNSSYGNIQADGATGGIDIEAADSLSITVNGGISNGTVFHVAVDAAGQDDLAAVPGTITDNSAIWSFTATESATNAGSLDVTAVSNASSVTTSANTASTFTAIDSALAGGATGDFVTVTGQIFAFSDAATADTALATLDPEVSGDAAQGSFNATNLSLGAFTSHMDNIRTGVNAGETGYSFGDGFRNTTFWVKGFGNMIDQDARGGVSGYEAATGGTALGFDGEISEKARLGIGGGWAYTDTDTATTGSDSKINSYSGTLYYTRNEEPWYLDAAFSFAWNDIDGTRQISFPGLERTAKADYDGQQYTGLLGGGYVIKQNQFEITPLASLQYSHLSLDGYTETGADSLNLTVASQNYDILQSGLGVKLAYPYKVESEQSSWLAGTWLPEVHFKWLYDFIGDKVSTSSTFAGGGAAFTTNGLDPAQNSFNIGGGLSFYSNGNTTLMLGYDAELKSDFVGHSGSVTWKIMY